MQELAARLAAIQVPCESVENSARHTVHLDHLRERAPPRGGQGWTLTRPPAPSALFQRWGNERPHVEVNVSLELTRLSVREIQVSHDAAEPVALVATAHSSGVRVGVACLGATTASLCKAFDRLACPPRTSHDGSYSTCSAYRRRSSADRRTRPPEHRAAAAMARSARIRTWRTSSRT
jgi:hypothetical protein